ncbi:bifunctional phosphopantothenoylcysteine decarboxylase/phosphopantothenate--cysteine ligase CoaBC [Cucumibacter marinus]|uniref:bifunctional phosphopantothenoylcysteine decarboxylase/phosphopantothenate--cysteine ligase CoaBC n=1 Tax=Cucumibacter marinus TaxID=1121252 RepID=UPI00040B95B0|nr:bifunctional phosphopantothenoylcysteine decarboxylase/phosphopantothenate--cysteine ligase CoaBC [Cucumibacter marinus]
MTGIAGKHVLLIVTGGIAAYKALELTRLIQKAGGTVQPILTRAATEFVTPLSIGTLAGHAALTELFDLTREAEIGHIELSRSADLIVVAPASADFLAKMAQGHADDLASTTVLATDTEIMIAPAMNVRMWEAPATRRNVAQLRSDGVHVVGPDEGDMACGEFGPGRMAEPQAILEAITAHFDAKAARGRLKGLKAVVTSGPTREWIDPVRYISNESSGRQGTAIAKALIAEGAEVVFVTGPAKAPRPAGCRIIEVETALEMDAAVQDALPADFAVCVAAVADWRMAEAHDQKLKKTPDGTPPTLELTANPDILAGLSQGDQRPRLVIGFAAETENLEANAARKRKTKGCDWILANDVSAQSGTFGGPENSVILLTESGAEPWPSLPKSKVGHRLAARIASHFGR